MQALKLIPACKSYLWGGTRLKEQYHKNCGEEILAECWEVSVHRDGPSVIESGPNAGATLAQYLSEHPQALGGAQELPILIKLIDAADRLSVQVHPDDAFARRYENDNGKTEMWYVVDALPGSGIYCGLRRDSTPGEVRELTEEKRIEELLNFIPVRKGDCFLITAGTLHAIGKGCLICEVQQSSNVTYRVYDYGRRGKDGRERELHLDKALQVIDYRAFRDGTGSGAPIALPGGRMRRLTSCSCFECFEARTDGGWSLPAAAGFLTVTAVDGAGTVCGNSCRAGDSFFVPAGTALQAQGKLTLVMAALPGTIPAILGHT